MQVPRVAIAPRAKFTQADDAAFLASGYGLAPDPWQMLVLEDWLAERGVNGKWASTRCGLAVPRQNGKNALLEIRELYGMVVLGEKFLHTAHEVKTARKAFLRLASFFENERHWPELAALVVEIRRTNGQEAIILSNGGSIEFVARSKGSGRGFTVDVLVCDEAQELSEDALAALLPTISAAPLGNPQVIMTGTPPGPTMDGAAWTRLRQAAMDGSKRHCWHEWSVEGVVDVTKREHWFAVNPALGDRLDVETVADELASMDPDTFARERLGRWPVTSKIQIFNPHLWVAGEESAPPATGLIGYSLDMTPDGARLSIGACIKPPDDAKPHIEVVKNVSAVDTSWVVDWFVERWPNTCALVIDGQSPAMAFVPALRKRKVRVTVTGAGDMATACAMLERAVTEQSVTHFPQPGLDRSLALARKRAIGQGGMWGYDRIHSDADITPPVAVTLAHYGAMTSKRRPGRRSKVTVHS